MCNAFIRIFYERANTFIIFKSILCHIHACHDHVNESINCHTLFCCIIHTMSNQFEIKSKSIFAHGKKKYNNEKMIHLYESRCVTQYSDRRLCCTQWYDTLSLSLSLFLFCCYFFFLFAIWNVFYFYNKVLVIVVGTLRLFIVFSFFYCMTFSSVSICI